MMVLSMSGRQRIFDAMSVQWHETKCATRDPSDEGIADTFVSAGGPVGPVQRAEIAATDTKV
jgi:hypothetical protein